MPAVGTVYTIGMPRLELGISPPKDDVLPLHYTPISVLAHTARSSGRLYPKPTRFGFSCEKAAAPAYATEAARLKGEQNGSQSA